VRTINNNTNFFNRNFQEEWLIYNLKSQLIKMKNIFILCIVAIMFCNFQSAFANKKVSTVDVTGNELLLISDLNSELSFNEFYTVQYRDIDFSLLSSYDNFEFVSFTKTEVKIKSGETILTFKLTGDNSANEFMGYGIAHHTSDDGFTLNKITTGTSGGVIQGKKNVKDTNGNVLSCDSGGPGSSQCDTGSGVGSVNTQCEVTCGSGYYSCYDGQGKCGCVANVKTTSVGTVQTINLLFL
jgi:hypothetical protein